MSTLIQTQTTSFKVDVLSGVFDFSSDTSQAFKVALYDGDAMNLDASTTVYTTTGEITGTNYTAGGNTATLIPVTSDGTTATLSFNTVSWASATFSASGALLYKSGSGNQAIAVLDFGGRKTVTSGTFNVTFPNNNATSAIIRIA